MTALPWVSRFMPSHVRLVIRGSLYKYFDTKSFSSVDFIVSNWASVSRREKKSRSCCRWPRRNTKYDLFLLHLTQALADFLRLLHAVHAVVVESHVEGVTLVLVLHPLWPTVALRAAIGLWGSVQSGSWFRTTQQRSPHHSGARLQWRRASVSDGVLLWEAVVTVVL